MTLAVKQKQATILYIEDDAQDRQLVTKLLQGCDFRVFTAANGLKGIEFAKATKPDLVILDTNLPDLDGFEITTRLRSLPTTATTPIIVLTADNNQINRNLSLAVGCNGFLTKPINKESFPQKIQAFLDGYEESLSDEKRNEVLILHSQRTVVRLEDKINELEAVNSQLRELDNLKNDFIAIISHELRTPINLLTGYTHLLKRHVVEPIESEGPAYLENVVDGLEESVNRLGDLVNEVLSVSQIASGNISLDIDEVDLLPLIEEILNNIYPICEERELAVKLATLEDLPAIEADLALVRTAIKNILGNAIKFTPNGGQIFIDGELLPEMVHLTIRDTGIGIPLDQQSRIFNQFISLNPVEHHTTSKHAYQGGGLGLGLAIARGLIEAHGGRVSVDSSGQDKETLPGSTFHIFLPIKQDQRIDD